MAARTATYATTITSAPPIAAAGPVAAPAPDPAATSPMMTRAAAIPITTETPIAIPSSRSNMFTATPSNRQTFPRTLPYAAATVEFRPRYASDTAKLTAAATMA